MRRAVLMAFVLIASQITPAPVAQAQSTGLIRFINNTAVPLVFSVDGDEETCQAAPTRECNVRYEVGKHLLFAEYTDGKSRARKTIDLKSSGFTWTID